MNIDDHRLAFMEEAAELLAELEQSLLEWEENIDDGDVVDRIFRAMHTIKGSGAMFGFDDIAAFTHEVETALDMVREGLLPASRDLINLILASRDQIKAMIEADPGTRQIEGSDVARLMDSFRDLTSSVRHGPARPATPGQAPLPVSGETVTYRIRFRPPRDIFLSGANPLLLLNELRDLGRAEVRAHMDDVPLLEEIDPEGCYVYWDVILSTNRGVDAIRDVFIFVEDGSELHIEEIDQADAYGEEISPVQRLGEILVSRGDVPSQAVEDVLRRRPPLGRALVEAGVTSPSKVNAALAEQKLVKEVREERRKAQDVKSIRVASGRLDKLVDLVGEMVTVQARLSQTAARHDDTTLLTIAEDVERLTAELRDNAMSTRMVPIGTLFSKFRRLVRDLSQELGREVDMVTEGAETELDKTIIERLNDPLIHLIRNSIDHGIERPDTRQATGKPRRGTLRVSAMHSGAYVLIRIQDDGAGIDADRVRAKAEHRGLIPQDADLTEREITNLIFAPGFSTSDAVTGVSGRGVGMDVVKRNIESLKGSVEVESQKGRGTAITLKLPLTLAIIDGLLVTIGHGYYIIPLSVIEECVELTEQTVRDAQGRETLTVRNELVPYVRLRDRFQIEGHRPAIEQVVIGRVDAERIGLVVDRVIGEHQTVIKNLGPFFRQATDFSGATILGDGSVALILDLYNLIQAA